MIESKDAVIDEGVFQRVIDGEELPVAEAIANKIAILKDFSADRKGEVSSAVILDRLQNDERRENFLKEVEKLRFLVDYFSIR